MIYPINAVCPRCGGVIKLRPNRLGCSTERCDICKGIIHISIDKKDVKVSY